MEWWRQAFYLIFLYAIAIYATIRQLLRGHKKAEDIQRHDGKVAIVTGGALGIGLEITKTLCSNGVHVYIGTRTPEEAKKAIAAIKRDNTLARVDWIPLDLASLESVRNFAKVFIEKRLPLHILINNAGVMLPPYQMTKDGFELQFQVNYLGHFLLTRLLLDTLHNSAQPRSYARVVNVSSIAHFGGSINPLTLHTSKIMPETEYSRYKAYGDSKLAVVLGTQELQRRIYNASRRVTVNSLHPGMVNSDLYRHLQPYIQMVKIIVAGGGLMWSKKKGSATAVYAALSEDMEGVGGCYLDNCDSVASSSVSYDRKLQIALWHVSSDWCNVPKDILSRKTLQELNSQSLNGNFSVRAH